MGRLGGDSAVARGVAVGLAAFLFLVLPAAAWAGTTLTPPGPPGAAAAAMFTLEDIYNRLLNGAAGAKTDPFTEPTSVGPSMHTLNDIMTKAPAAHALGAAPADVCTGTWYWGLISGPGSWGLLQGTGPCTPYFSSTYGPFSVAENTAASANVGTPVTATSASAITYAITGGNTGTVFAIGSSTGQITTTGTATNYEGTRAYYLTITATSNSRTATTLVTVNVTDVDEFQPAFVGNGPFSVPEGSVNGTVVGRVQATDADGTSTITYAITGGNTGTVFAIASATGQITCTGNATDHETTKSYDLTVTASDDGGTTTVSTTVKVYVVNVNDNDPVCSPDPLAVNVPENASGYRVGAATCTDADGDVLTYTESAGDTGLFAVNSSSGQVTTSAGLDREAATGGAATYTYTVQASDGSRTDTTTVSVTVTDVNEGPSVGLNLPLTVTASSTTVIDESYLRIDDVDSTAGQLILTITELPTKGTLQVDVTTNNWKTIFENRSFVTQTDVNGNNLRYVAGAATGSDSFKFTVSDSEGGTIAETTFSITVN